MHSTIEYATASVLHDVHKNEEIACQICQIMTAITKNMIHKLDVQLI